MLKKVLLLFLFNICFIKSFENLLTNYTEITLKIKFNKNNILNDIYHNKIYDCFVYNNIMNCKNKNRNKYNIQYPILLIELPEILN
jgi:hypothetical protein